MKKVSLGILLSVIVSMLFVGCFPEPNPPAAVESIEVSTSPDKIYYQKGEELDTTGLIVSALYDDSSKVEISDYTLSDFDSEFSSDEQEITVTYTAEGKEYTTSFKVYLNDNPLQELIISSKPNQLIYSKDEELNTTGLVVSAKYGDNTLTEVTDYTFSSSDSIDVPNQKLITVSYTEKNITMTAEFLIYVTESYLDFKTVEELNAYFDNYKDAYVFFRPRTSNIYEMAQEGKLRDAYRNNEITPSYAWIFVPVDGKTQVYEFAYMNFEKYDSTQPTKGSDTDLPNTPIFYDEEWTITNESGYGENKASGYLMYSYSADFYIDILEVFPDGSFLMCYVYKSSVDTTNKTFTRLYNSWILVPAPIEGR